MGGRLANQQAEAVASSDARRRRWSPSRLFNLIVLAVPLLAAAVAVIRTSINIPYTDDYDAIGDFLNRYMARHGFFSRAGWVLTAQHVQYKLIFLHTIVALQYQITGHTNYRTMQWLGDLSIPAILALLWWLVRRQRWPLDQSLWILVTPWYLFLSLSYSETINWAMSGLQNLAIIPIAVATILLLTEGTRRATAWGIAFLALSIATSGNGFFVAAALLPVLLFRRQYKVAFGLTVTTVLMAALYFFHYSFNPMGPSNGVSHVALLTFPFTFLGDILVSPHRSTALGLAIVGIFIALLFRDWPRRSPETFCIALFCLITACGVAATRYHFGPDAAMPSRYHMYSLLMLSAEYIAFLRLFAPLRIRQRSIWGSTVCLAVIVAMVFGLSGEVEGYRELLSHRQLLLAHFILWERHPERIVLSPDEIVTERTPESIVRRIRFQRYLHQAIASGLYIPPASASDPLPIRPGSPATRGIEDEPPPPAR